MNTKPVITILICIILILSAPKIVAADYYIENNLEEAWDITTGNPDITIAVIDSGVKWHKPGFNSMNRWINTAEKVGLDNVDDDGNGYIDDIYGWDFIDFNNDSSTHYGQDIINPHGSKVTGVIAADHLAEPRGIAPDVSIMDLRFTDNNGFGSIDTMSEAMSYAVSMGADIISLSIILGATIMERDQGFRDAVNAQVLVIMPEANFGLGVFTEEFDDFVIGVNGLEYEYSPIEGPKHNIHAPQLEIPTLDENGESYRASAISFAVPQVAATLGLMLSIHQSNRGDLIDVLMDSTKTLVLDSGSKIFQLDVGKAVITWKDFTSQLSDDAEAGNTSFILFFSSILFYTLFWRSYQMGKIKK